MANSFEVDRFLSVINEFEARKALEAMIRDIVKEELRAWQNRL